MPNLRNINLHSYVNLPDEDKSILLHNSVVNCQLEKVKNLLKSHANVSLVNEDGNTPLHVAVIKNDHPMVEAILEYSSHPRTFINAITLDNDNTALHIASRSGCYEIVRCLLSHGANFEVKNSKGCRPIDITRDNKVKKLLVDVELDSRLAAAGKFKTLQPRLDAYSQAKSMAELAASVYARNHNGMTSLQMAVMNFHCNTVRVIADTRVHRLQACNYKIDTDELLDKIGVLVRYARQSSKHKASLTTHSQKTNVIGGEAMFEKIVDILSAASHIVKHAKEIFQPHDGEPYEQPEILTVIEETLEVLEFKPEYADCEDRRTLREKNDRYCKMLFDKDDDKVTLYMGILQITITENISDFMKASFKAKLVDAAKSNDLEMFKLCIDEVDNVNICGVDNRTPLSFATENGNEEMVSELLQKKANLYYYTDWNTQTALHLATRNGHVEIVKLLLQYRDKLDLANVETAEEGQTAVHIAAKIDRLDILKILLVHDGIYNRTDKYGKRPIEITKNREVIRFLEHVDELFGMAKYGNECLITRLEALQKDELLAVCKANNTQRHTLADVAKIYRHTAIHSKISKLLEKFPPTPKIIEGIRNYDDTDHYQLMLTLALSAT